MPVSELSALARALLSDNLGGRDVVPGHVADRVNRQAAEWAAHGFTEGTVRPWLDIPPSAAAYLAHRGVDPAVLDLPVKAYAGAQPVALRLAISSERMPVERVYELLVLTDHHTPEAAEHQARPGVTGQPTPAAPAVRVPPVTNPIPAAAGAEPAPVATPARPVAPVVFSHAATDEAEQAESRRANDQWRGRNNHRRPPHRA